MVLFMFSTTKIDRNDWQTHTADTLNPPIPSGTGRH